MENALPALVIAGVLIIAAAVLGNVTNHSVNEVGGAWRDMEAVSEERLGTDLSVLAAILDQDNHTLTILLQNNGRTSISDFEEMDLIANYDGEGGRYNIWLPYTEAVLQPLNSWKVAGFSNDSRNPGILDTGEAATIVISLSPDVTGPDNRWISLATETGISYTVTF